MFSDLYLKQYFEDNPTRPEGPASKLRQEMRKQAREDARRMVVAPQGPREFTRQSKRNT